MKKFRLSDDGMIGGVCGGIAEYFGIDPVILRILFMVLLLTTNLPTIIIYMILWISMSRK